MPNLLNRFSQWANERRKLVWLLLFVLVLAVLAIVLTPVFQITPFKAQTPRIMTVAYTMRRWSPLLTVLASLVTLTLTVVLWSEGRWWSRIVLVILLLPVLGATWFAQQNHFEWMFNPLSNPAYVKSNDASFINDADRVMAVTIGDESVAYPIRIMAYHHLVADTVGGTPIVATY
jgi:glucan phosphoethanolaminetransferase (alkaline phosphatase superfamily)